jgi:hypothetical protein
MCCWRWTQGVGCSNSHTGAFRDAWEIHLTTVSPDDKIKDEQGKVFGDWVIEMANLRFSSRQTWVLRDYSQFPNAVGPASIIADTTSPCEAGS